MKRLVSLIALLLTVFVSIGYSQTQKETPKPKPPMIVGDWTGTWGLYTPPAPAKEGEPAPAAKPVLPHFQMTCKVEQLSEGKYQAAFEGNAGRAYKFVIKMPGRQVGSVALFSGTTDLGEKDGGVYDWIGRATDKEFVGFFTSQGYTGSFRLTRP